MAVASETLERSHGCLRLGAGALGARTRLTELYQSGCLKARLPKRTTGSLEAICINTSGGLTDGDTLDTSVDCARGTATVITSQAAERIYRARHGAAAVTNTIELGPDAAMAWLPQETILFDGGRLERSINVSLTSSSTFLAVEMAVMGRTAMGESVSTGLLQDSWALRIDGRLEFIDRTRFDGNVAQKRGRPAVLDGSMSMATVVYAAADSVNLLESVREQVAGDHIHSGASLLGQVLVARLVSPDAAALRRRVMAVLESVASTRPEFHLPKVWTL